MRIEEKEQKQMKNIWTDIHLKAVDVCGTSGYWKTLLREDCCKVLSDENRVL